MVTDDDAMAERMRLLRSHGMTTLTWDRHRGHARATTSSPSASTTASTSRGPRSLPPGSRAWTRDTARRRVLDAAYREKLADVPGVTPTQAPAHHIFTVVLDEGIDRDAVRAALQERGIQTSLHYPPVHRFSIYTDRAPSFR